MCIRDRDKPLSSSAHPVRDAHGYMMPGKPSHFYTAKGLSPLQIFSPVFLFLLRHCLRKPCVAMVSEKPCPLLSHYHLPKVVLLFLRMVLYRLPEREHGYYCRQPP